MPVPKLVPLDHIKKLEDEQHEKYVNMLTTYDKQKRLSDPVKERWLAIYAQCLSPSIACKQTGISMETYSRWRGKDPAFCRGINACIEAARDELVGSAMNRAIGYVREDPETGEIETDAMGKIVYHNGDSSLTRHLLEDKDSGKATGNVVVNVDFGGLFGNNRTAIDSNRNDVIEHDADPTEPPEPPDPDAA